MIPQSPQLDIPVITKDMWFLTPRRWFPLLGMTLCIGKLAATLPSAWHISFPFSYMPRSHSAKLFLHTPGSDHPSHLFIFGFLLVLNLVSHPIISFIMVSCGVVKYLSPSLGREASEVKNRVFLPLPPPRFSWGWRYGQCPGNILSTVDAVTR